MPGARAPRIAVFGAGSVGALVAGRLAAAGRQVTLVARGSRLADVRANGVRLADEGGPVSRIEVAACAADEAGVHDIVFIALKGGDVPAARADIARLVGPATLVVPLLNGIPWWYRQPTGTAPVRAVDPEGALALSFAPERLAGAVLFLTSALHADGVVHVRGRPRIVVGPVVEGNGRALEGLAAVFAGSGIDLALVPDVRADMWSKVALNLATNPLSVVAEATLEAQFHDPALLAVVRQVLEEVLALARAEGCEPRLGLEEMIAVGARQGPFRTSMAQDFAAGRTLELGAICGSVFELAEEAGMAMPVARALHDLCAFRAARRACASA